VALFSLLLVVLAAGGAGLASWRIVERQMAQATTTRLNQAARTFATLYQQRVNDAQIVALLLATRALLREQLLQGDWRALTRTLTEVARLRPSYAFTVADASGAVLARILTPGFPDTGPSLRGLSGVEEALQGRPTTSVIRSEDCALAVAVSVPVFTDQSQLIGVLQVRVPLDELFVQQVKADTGLELSLYCGDVLIATTLPSGGAALRSQAEAEVVRRVIQEGLEYEHRVRVAGTSLHARYVPLWSAEEELVALYAVGIPQVTLLGERTAILKYFVPLLALIALLAAALGDVGSIALTRSLHQLTQAAARIGVGDLTTPVAVRGADEVGALAANMEEMRRRLSEQYTQLQELNRLKDEYLFSVAHELRTPLASLVASTEILAADYAVMDPQELRLTVRRIERGVARLSRMVENVLDAGSIRAGRFSLHSGPLWLDEVVADAVATVQPLLEEKRQSIRLSLPDGLPAVQADARRVGQVLANLLSNANKYGPEGDCIAVAVAPAASVDAPPDGDPAALPAGRSECPPRERPCG